MLQSPFTVAVPFMGGPSPGSLVTKSEALADPEEPPVGTVLAVSSSSAQEGELALPIDPLEAIPEETPGEPRACTRGGARAQRTVRFCAAKLEMGEITAQSIHTNVLCLHGLTGRS